MNQLIFNTKKKNFKHLSEYERGVNCIISDKDSYVSGF